MGLGSWWHWLLVILVLVLLFGTNKISGLMGDLAKGIKSFKREMATGEEEPEEEQAPSETKVIEHKVEKSQARAKSAPRAKVPRKQKSG